MTASGKEGLENDMAALEALTDAKPDLMDGAQRSQNRELMDKNRIDLLPKIIAETLTKDWYDCLNHSTLANRSPSPAP